MTQRGPLSSLSPSQRAYYKGVDKKMKRAYQEALRRIYADQSSVALQLARDIGFLNTFDPNLPQSVRYKYIEASERKDRAIVQSCGFNSLF